jgi:hypothetical protein
LELINDKMMRKNMIIAKVEANNVNFCGKAGKVFNC